MKKLIVFVASAVMTFFGVAANAALDASATTALTGASTDANTAGGLVIGAVAVVAGISLVLGLLRKA